jgi:hypothetical protein
MWKILLACAALTAIAVSPAVAQSDGRSEAIAQCRAEGFGKSGASPDASRAAMQACVKRKMQKKKR